MRKKVVRLLVEQLEDRLALSTVPTQEWILSDPDYQNVAFWGSGYEGSPYWNQSWGYAVAGSAQAPYNAVEFISGDVMKNVPGQNGLLFPGLSSSPGDYVDANGFAIERDGFYIPSLEGIQGEWRYAWGSNFAVFMPGGAEEPPPGGGGEEPPPEEGGGGGGVSDPTYDAWLAANPNNSNSAYWGSGHTESIYYNPSWGVNVALGASAPYNQREFISGDLMTNVPGQNGMFFPGLTSNPGDTLDVNGYAELSGSFYVPSNSSSDIQGVWRYANGSNFATFIPGVPDVQPPEATTATAVAGVGCVHLCWTESENATCYNVFRNGQLIATTSNLSFADYGLAGGVCYNYSVQAENEVGCSALSNVVAATTIDSGWVWVLSDSSLNTILELCNQAVDTGNAGTLTLEDGTVLYGDRYNVVGAPGGIVKGVIYSLTNQANGSRYTGFDYRMTITVDVLLNGVWTPLSFDLYAVA